MHSLCHPTLSTHYSVLTTQYSLLTTHYSLLTTYCLLECYSLLTTYCSRQVHELFHPTWGPNPDPNLNQVHELFHPTWGQLLKAGQQNSKWAQQVQTYACL